jgi:aryl-alcohol dehydrogenase-like predicted oxidoreductase
MVGDEGLLAKVQKLQPLAREAGYTMSQLALAWILRRAEVTSCIVGATRPGQVEENAGASEKELDEEVVRRMEEILA